LAAYFRLHLKSFFIFFCRILFRSLYFSINFIFFAYKSIKKGKKPFNMAQIFFILFTYRLGKRFAFLAAASNLLLGRGVSVANIRFGFREYLLFNKRLTVSNFLPYLLFLKVLNIIIIIAFI